MVNRSPAGFSDGAGGRWSPKAIRKRRPSMKHLSDVRVHGRFPLMAKAFYLGFVVGTIRLGGRS
ncbi:hypothetical protein SSA02_11660 [Swaminathania salitolerans]|uniref:Uncharacterized protein n=1 Tax=Swaminathania salitolerans TaxID=182838 RepID=A0A511BQ86_9PROT|nr:hypothetical protein SSA02_11660 [Swaminathania salitolerans]